MAKKIINVQGTAVTILKQKEDDYIIQNWLRNRNTIEFLGVWEHLFNPTFKTIEFDGFKKQASTAVKRLKEQYRC